MNTRKKRELLSLLRQYKSSKRLNQNNEIYKIVNNPDKVYADNAEIDKKHKLATFTYKNNTTAKAGIQEFKDLGFTDYQIQNNGKTIIIYYINS